MWLRWSICRYEKEMITEQERCRNEAIKELLKQAVQANPNLNSNQKQMAINNIERAAQQADWIVEMMRMSGYLR